MNSNVINFHGAVKDESQRQALKDIESLIHDPEGTRGLLGSAGVGKTTVLREAKPLFRQCAATARRSVIICAPTNKAAEVLRAKDVRGYRWHEGRAQLLQPVSFHAAIYVPLFTPAYYQLEVIVEQEDIPDFSPGSEDWARFADLLTHPRIDGEWHRVLNARTVAQGDLNAALAYLHLEPLRDLFIDWVERTSEEDRGALLVVDEASMLTSLQLASAQKGFDRVLLVGDDAQLRPVKSAQDLKKNPFMSNALDALKTYGYPITYLRKVHRQGAGSGVLRFADHIRDFNNDPLEYLSTGQIPLAQGASDEDVYGRRAGDWLLDDVIAGVPGLVSRNETRINLIRAARRHQGYDGLPPQPGEPVIFRHNKGDANYMKCEWKGHEQTGRSRTPNKNETGVIVGTNAAAGTITVRCDSDPELMATFRPFWEDHNSDREPRSVAVRFGYAQTTYTAQGSEWPRVLVCLDSYEEDYRWHVTRDNARPWFYTSVTRAREQVVLVTGLKLWLRAKLAGTRDTGIPKPTTSQIVTPPGIAPGRRGVNNTGD